jgi:hypothetical protein
VGLPVLMVRIEYRNQTKQRLVAMEKHVAATGAVLTEAQVAALEKKADDDVAHGEIETADPGYLGSQDTFHVGTLKGVGRIYQQSFVDTFEMGGSQALHHQITDHGG